MWRSFALILLGNNILSASRIIIKLVVRTKVLIKLAQSEVLATNLCFTRRYDIIFQVREAELSRRELPCFTLLTEFDFSPTPGTSELKHFLL